MGFCVYCDGLQPLVWRKLPMAIRKMKKTSSRRRIESLPCISMKDIAPLIPFDGSCRKIEFNRDGTIKSMDPPLTREEMEAAAKMTEGFDGALWDLFYEIQGVFEEVLAAAGLSDEDEIKCRIYASMEALSEALQREPDNKSRRLACKKVRKLGRGLINS